MNYHKLKRSELEKKLKKLKKSLQAAKKQNKDIRKSIKAEHKKRAKKLEIFEKQLAKAEAKQAKHLTALEQAKAALKELNHSAKIPSKRSSKPSQEALAEGRVADSETKIKKVGSKSDVLKVTKAKAARAETSKTKARALKVEKKTAKAISTDLAQPDDLTLINGIGPKLADLLNNAGITSWAQLARRKAASLQKILDAAGPHYRRHNPENWPAQAALAKAGKFAELEALQTQLKKADIMV